MKKFYIAHMIIGHEKTHSYNATTVYGNGILNCEKLTKQALDDYLTFQCNHYNSVHPHISFAEGVNLSITEIEND